VPSAFHGPIDKSAAEDVGALAISGKPADADRDFKKPLVDVIPSQSDGSTTSSMA
jgi:hypothetical protein